MISVSIGVRFENGRGRHSDHVFEKTTVEVTIGGLVFRLDADNKEQAMVIAARTARVLGIATLDTASSTVDAASVRLPDDVGIPWVTP